MYYDSEFGFKTCNPIPKGDEDWILRQTIKMFSELSPETKEFIKFMNENELINYKSKIGKVIGGYQTYIPKYKSLFIFQILTELLTMCKC